ncbi:hypothetical protein [Streptomyces sp. HNS054]|uniref:hypothetical protein n=1 Tax=Streptomyces sp. HNS054 TaxID=1662446 RepID=UPI00069FEE4B
MVASAPQGVCEAIHADMPACGLAAAHGRIALEKHGRRAEDRFAYRPERTPERRTAGSGGKDRAVGGGRRRVRRESGPPRR